MLLLLPISVLLCGTVFVLPLPFSTAERITGVVAILTWIGAVVGYYHARHFQELQIFRELFREFNSRYDILNERLNEIRGRQPNEPLKDERIGSNKSDIDVLYDYFNLCAEEYMYEAAGYIDPRVWIAWQVGMAYFAKDPEIRALWEDELQTQQKSYYGFSLDNILNV